MAAEHRNARGIRELCEIVLERARFLDPPDRAVLEQVLGRGSKPCDVATVAGVSTRTVQRKVRELTRHLADPRIEYVLRHCRGWAQPLGEIAMAVWVKRRPQRRAAEELGLSLHEVRQCVAAIRALIDEGAPMRRRGAGPGSGLVPGSGAGRRTRMQLSRG